MKILWMKFTRIFSVMTKKMNKKRGNKLSFESSGVRRCAELHMYIGKAINVAHQNPNLPFDLGIRQNLVEQLKKAVEKMGKTVTVTYY